MELRSLKEQVVLQVCQDPRPSALEITKNPDSPEINFLHIFVQKKEEYLSPKTFV